MTRPAGVVLPSFIRFRASKTGLEFEIIDWCDDCMRHGFDDRIVSYHAWLGDVLRDFLEVADVLRTLISTEDVEE